jgi:cell wall assembly regulator SMI1
MKGTADVRVEWRPAVVKTLATFDGPAPLHWLLDRLESLGLEGGRSWAKLAVREAVYAGELEALRADGSVIRGAVVLNPETLLRLPKKSGQRAGPARATPGVRK